MFSRKEPKPILLSIHKIWDYAQHNALTDLIIFKNKFFCVFRESDSHVGGLHGAIRIIESQNGLEWKSKAYLSKTEIDLRDPKLCITPDGRLMLTVGGSSFGENNVRDFHQSYSAFSSDGTFWSDFYPVIKQEEWLWRVTWHQGIAYGVSYRFSSPSERKTEWIATLWKSQNGLDFEPIMVLPLTGKPNEATVRFSTDGHMLLLIRREATDKDHACLGISFPPFEDWLWKEYSYHIGGPNFLIISEQNWWAAGRLSIDTLYGTFHRTVLGKLSLKTFKPSLILPSGGDCSYPGMVYHQGILWMSYYSSHEDNKAAIYLAQIDLP